MNRRISTLFAADSTAPEKSSRPCNPFLLLKLIGLMGLLTYVLWLYKKAEANLGATVIESLYLLIMLPGWSLSLIAWPETGELLVIQIGLIAVVCYAVVIIVYLFWRWGHFSSVPWVTSGRILVIIQVVGLLLIIGPLLSLRTVYLFPDATSYLTWGLNLATGQGYTELGEPVLRRGPVHAALLAIPFSLFAPTLDVGLIMPKLMGLLNLLLIYWLGRLLFNGWAGFLGAALATSNSMMMFHFFGSHMLDNTLALFVNLSLLTFYVALRKQRYDLFALVGVWQALAVLTKALGVMWVPVPWLFLLLSPKFQNLRSFIGAWLGNAVFLLLFYPWLAYVYYLGNQIVLLEGRGNPATLWLLIHVGMGLYLAGGVALISWGKLLTHFLKKRWPGLCAQWNKLTLALGGLTIALLLLFPVLRAIGSFSQFSLSSTGEYLQLIVQPVVAPLGPLMLLAWIATVILACRSASHRLLGLALILSLPIYLLLSQRGWQVRNFFSMFLLSYLLLGHYLVWIWQWLTKTVTQLTLHRSLGMLNKGLTLVVIGLILTQTVSSITKQVLDNRARWQLFQAQSPYQDLKGQITTNMVNWIDRHLPPGAQLVTFDEAWPQLTYFRLGGTYPMLMVPFERMNAAKLKSYLTSSTADKVVYIQHERDSFPIFHIFPEKKLYNILKTNRADYLIVGGKHMSLFGSLDFFHTHPAFTQVYQTEYNRAGIAIFKVELDQLDACLSCPTVIDDWSWYHLGSLAAASNWGLSTSELVRLLGNHVTISYQPNLLNFAETGMEDIDELTTLGLARDAGLYLELLQSSTGPPVRVEDLLIEAYASLAQIYAKANDSEQALLALERAITLDPTLISQYQSEIEHLRENITAFYTVWAGQDQEISPLLEYNLPLLSWEIYQIRGQSSPKFLRSNPEILTIFLQQYQDKYGYPPDFKLLSQLSQQAILPSQNFILVLAQAYARLGNWYKQQDDPNVVTAMLEAYWQALTLDPLNEEARQALVEVYMGRGDVNLTSYLRSKTRPEWEQAVESYRQAVELMPYNAAARQALLHAYFARPDQLQEAVLPLLNGSEAQLNDLVQGWLLLGGKYTTLYSETGQQNAAAEAAAAYSRAFTLASTHYGVLSDVITTYVMYGDTIIKPILLHNVLAAYESETLADPGNLAVYEQLAIAYTRLGRLSEALATYRRATEVNSDNPDAHALLAQAYASQQQPELAIHYYERALAIAPDRIDFIIPLAALYQKQAQKEAALSLLAIAGAQAPEAAWPHVELGKLYLMESRGNQ